MVKDKKKAGNKAAVKAAKAAKQEKKAGKKDKKVAGKIQEVDSDAEDVDLDAVLAQYAKEQEQFLAITVGNFEHFYQDILLISITGSAIRAPSSKNFSYYNRKSSKRERIVLIWWRILQRSNCKVLQ